MKMKIQTFSYENIPSKAVFSEFFIFIFKSQEELTSEVTFKLAGI